VCSTTKGVMTAVIGERWALGGAEEAEAVKNLEDWWAERQERSLSSSSLMLVMSLNHSVFLAGQGRPQMQRGDCRGWRPSSKGR
jgi:hypothetical protein